MIVDVWDYEIDAEDLDRALLDRRVLDEWNALTRELVDLSAKMQQRLSDEGRKELSAIIELVDPYDHTRVYATATNGELVFDIVDATPAGELISGQK